MKKPKINFLQHYFSQFISIQSLVLELEISKKIHFYFQKYRKREEKGWIIFLILENFE